MMDFRPGQMRCITDAGEVYNGIYLVISVIREAANEAIMFSRPKYVITVLFIKKIQMRKWIYTDFNKDEFLKDKLLF